VKGEMTGHSSQSFSEKTALSSHAELGIGGYVEFLTANTPTAFAARYVICFAELEEVAVHFLKTGERSKLVSWQILNPRAIVEDAKKL
jgi:hypothetical protein